MVVTVTFVLAASGGGVAFICAAPRLTAAFISRVSRHLLADVQLREDSRQAFVELCAETDDEVAAVLWSPAMSKGMGDAIVRLFRRQDYHEAVSTLCTHLTCDQSLQETIREGVLEAFQDEALKAEAKSLFIEGLRDEHLRNELTKAAIQTVKTGIREAVEDTELKEVITVAIRDALGDERLSGVVRGALKEALADQELHKATLQGAVNAMNPIPKLMQNLGLRPEVDASSGLAAADAGAGGFQGSFKLATYSSTSSPAGGADAKSPSPYSPDNYVHKPQEAKGVGRGKRGVSWRGASVGASVGG